ncbi:hypothetical protein MRB53_039688 [Persea americana]|nr:hypothetical protein MRB53_039688 [Persea americana]
MTTAESRAAGRTGRIPSSHMAVQRQSAYTKPGCGSRRRSLLGLERSTVGELTFAVAHTTSRPRCPVTRVQVAEATVVVTHVQTCVRESRPRTQDIHTHPSSCIAARGRCHCNLVAECCSRNRTRSDMAPASDVPRTNKESLEPCHTAQRRRSVSAREAHVMTYNESITLLLRSFGSQPRPQIASAVHHEGKVQAVGSSLGAPRVEGMALWGCGD